MANEDVPEVQPGASAAPAGGPAAPGASARIKLPEYWPHSPNLWFKSAECVFELHGVTNQRTMYCHAIAALPHDALCQVADILDSAGDAPFTALRERLMVAHDLTPVQRSEKIFQMPDLGDRRPTQLLAAMLEWCPRGEEKTAFFAGQFLRRLPPDMRRLLANEDVSDLKALAQRADALHILPQPVAAVAAVAAPPSDDECPDAIAAVQRPAGGRSGDARRQKGKGGNSKAGKQRKNFIVCWKHHQFAENAHSCADPSNCMWGSGN